MSDGFLENGFIIDLSNAKNTSEIISELSEILEMPAAKDKNICLKIGKINLSQAQMLSIKSLIESMNSKLAFIDTKSKKTKETVSELDIVISELSNKIKSQNESADNNETKKIKKEKKNKKTKSEEPKEELKEEKEEKEEINESENKEDNKKINAAETVKPEDSNELEEYSNSSQKINEDKSLEINEKDSYELVTEKPLQKEDLPEIKEVQQIETVEDSEEDEEDDEIEEMSEKDAKSEISKLPTLYLQQNLRSGQTMSYDGNIVIIGDTNAGSEIIAKGDITVWGILGGIAHAGARGNHYAKIRALKLNAIQLRISGYYARRADTDNIPYIQRSSQFVPEEASVSDGVIIIKKLNEN